MITEANRDLFLVPQGYYIAHSISADMNLGAGIAREIDSRYNMEKRLLNFKEFAEIQAEDLVGVCIPIANVFNLITKSEAFTKPTYGEILEALRSMRKSAEDNYVECIAMPRIGCGKDRLNWAVVKELIQEVFEDSDIEILVCFQ